MTNSIKNPLKENIMYVPATDSFFIARQSKFRLEEMIPVTFKTARKIRESKLLGEFLVELSLSQEVVF